MKTKISLLIAFLIVGFLSSCGPTDEALHVTETSIAASIFATWTANAPIPTLGNSDTPIPAVTATSGVWQTPTPLPQAVVKSEGLNLREGPGTDYPSQELLRNGNTLIVLGQTGLCNWIKVLSPTGRKGWVSGGDFYVSLNAPCEQIPSATFQPLNGSLLVDYRTFEGSGLLKIINPMVSDAVVILTNMSRYPVLAVYIHAGSEYLVENIPESTYEIYVDLGNDWLGDEMVFEESIGRYQALDLYNVTENNNEYTLTISTSTDEVSVAGEEFPILKE